MENKEESKEVVAKETKPAKKAAPAAKKAAPAPPPPPPQTAAQKLTALENAFMTQNEQINILAEEIDALRERVILLTKKLTASIQAAEQGGLTGESVNKIIMNEGIKELQGKVTFLVQQGVLVRNDESEINDKTFIVGREVDKEGNVTNPRVQFSIPSQGKELQDAIKGKKAGAMVAYSQSEDSIEVTEVYDIVDPKIKKNYEQPETAQ